MKHKKIIKEFYFTKDIEEVVSELDEISLAKHSDLIDKIYDKYPLISRVEIAIIIKTTFETLREILVRGGIIMFHRLFFDFKLLFRQRKEIKGARGTINIVKALIKTPPPLKERSSWKKRYRNKIIKKI